MTSVAIEKEQPLYSGMQMSLWGKNEGSNKNPLLMACALKKTAIFQ
jgi:hypothetical protein